MHSSSLRSFFLLYTKNTFFSARKNSSPTTKIFKSRRWTDVDETKVNTKRKKADNTTKSNFESKNKKTSLLKTEKNKRPTPNKSLPSNVPTKRPIGKDTTDNIHNMVKNFLNSSIINNFTQNSNDNKFLLRKEIFSRLINSTTNKKVFLVEDPFSSQPHFSILLQEETILNFVYQFKYSF